LRRRLRPELGYGAKERTARYSLLGYRRNKYVLELGAIKKNFAQY
jgi:hypothetical protein